MTDERALRFRNSQLTHFKRLGRTEWDVQSGYSLRIVESTMRRLKALTGEHLCARTPERRTVEVRLRCKVLSELAAPTWSAPAAA